METKAEQMEAIHASLVNGNRRQMAEYIQGYGLYDFFPDYLEYLKEFYIKPESVLEYFSDAVVSYHRIINR